VVPISPVAHYDVRDLMRLGASAYLLKSASVEHLVGTIRAAVFGPEGENVIVGMPLRMLEEAPKGAGELLTVREMEIVLLAARGLSNRQIASSLWVSESTVKRHLANAYPKMGVTSRGEAARKALLEEWITIQDITHEEEE
jgi:DNA-binding NarL/FixJ family response regulator